jgi:cysteinyl-tRNA synthetase
MPELYLYNTLSRRKEAFAPADPKRVTMYVCGPTVYNFAHIGNARPPVVFDVLFRLLRRQYGESQVLYARNFTDIDDRIIAKANEEAVPIDTITQRFTKIYLDDVSALGVLEPTMSPTATGHVAEMIALIERLIARGFAYRAQSGVYFAVEKMADYGKLSGRSLDDMKAGARVEGEDDKRAPADFALWKAHRPGEPHWEASFGAGRPGWHIECSAMIERNLGETIDIHAGGHDLIFPHHENEVAQSECAHGGAPLARVWMHNGFLTMNSEKMSKSLGNVVTIHDLLKDGWRGEVLRWALLSGHYRAPLDFTDALLEQSQASLDRIYGALERVKHIAAAPGEAQGAFVEALHDDLNTPKAMAELAAIVTALNSAKDDGARAELKGQLLAAGALIGLLQEDPEAWLKGAGDDAAEIDRLVAARFDARKAKNFAEADRIRNELAGRGIEVLDGPTGSTWRRTH